MSRKSFRHFFPPQKALLIIHCESFEQRQPFEMIIGPLNDQALALSIQTFLLIGTVCPEKDGKVAQLDMRIFVSTNKSLRRVSAQVTIQLLTVFT